MHTHVLVIDEPGICRTPLMRRTCCTMSSMNAIFATAQLLTTNKPPAALRDVLHDSDFAEAIVDRLLERRAHFAMPGRSYRTRHVTERTIQAGARKTA